MMLARADFLLPGLGKAPREAVEYFVKMQYARAQTQENPWYRLAMKISAFSGNQCQKCGSSNKTRARTSTFK